MIRWVTCVCLVVSMASCTAAPPRPAIAPALGMFLTTDDGRLVRYDLASNGTLRFAGGKDIMLERWSWTGSVTPAQGATLNHIVSTSNWATSTPAAHGSNSWKITVRDDDGRHTYALTDESPGVEAAWAILTVAGTARLQADLDRLPRPDIDTLVNRRRAEQAEAAE